MFFSLFFPLVTYAFSFSSLFNFSSSTESKDTQNGKQENLQSLKVFEPSKNHITVVEALFPKEIQSEEATSFAVNDEILKDDFSATSEHSHSDNAVYTVQKGDSIYSIASYFGVTVQTITSFNHMSDKEVHPGDVLEVPSTPGIMYTVKKGDTLSSISRKYNVDSEDVSLYNGLISTDDLAIGDEVFLPGAKETESIVKKVTKSKTSTIVSSSVKVLRGDTSHLNTKGDIAKYSSLPKYPGYYLQPVPGATRTQKMHGHNGVDLAGPKGIPVLASADGVVRVAKSSGYNFGYGNYIIVTHSNGSETVYAHLQSVSVAAGQAVSGGQQIGKLGSSGNSTGPHLHFEIRGAYNPFAW